jgi:hypothetical protein
MGNFQDNSLVDGEDKYSSDNEIQENSIKMDVKPP